MLDEFLQHPEDVPSYWQEAGRRLDEGDPLTRAIEIPGIEFANYRWGSSVDPITPGKVAVFVSRAQAEAQARAAAERWIERLAPKLEAAGIAHTSSIAVGPRRELLRRVGERRDIDRVLLGTRAGDPFRRWHRQSVAHLMDRPLVTVS